MATLFQRKNDKTWYMKYKDVSGKWRMQSCKTTKKSEAEQIRKQQEAKEFNRMHRAPIRLIKMDVDEAIEEFKQSELPKSFIGRDKQESSLRREIRAIDNFAEGMSIFGINKIQDISSFVVDDFLDGRKKAGISPRTRREELRLIRKFFKWAIANYLAVENPTEGMRILKDHPSTPLYFQKEELAEIFKQAKQPYVDIYKFLYLTGIRIGELTNLEWRDFIPQQQHIIIRVVSAKKGKENNGIRIEGNKTKREGTVPLNNEAIEILEKLKSEEKHITYIFTNDAGNKLDNDNIYRNLKRILKKCEIPHGSPHVFRHTFASHLVIDGISLYVVKELLRHKSIKETEIYAHLADESTKMAVKKLSTTSLM